MKLVKLINNPAAIPETYTQYPGMLPPSEVYGGTWEAQFEDMGIFFRTPGGTAGDFNGGVQEAANTEHKHTRGDMDITGELWGTNNKHMRSRMFGWSSGAFYLDASGTSLSAPGDWGSVPGGAGMARFSAARAWTGQTSADGVVDGRPMNMTYRIWKRVI